MKITDLDAFKGIKPPRFYGMSYSEYSLGLPNVHYHLIPFNYLVRPLWYLKLFYCKLHSYCIYFLKERWVSMGMDVGYLRGFEDGTRKERERLIKLLDTEFINKNVESLKDHLKVRIHEGNCPPLRGKTAFFIHIDEVVETSEAVVNIANLK